LYSGHKRKVGHVSFHPTAENVAASSSLDYTVKLWDVEKGKDNITLQHNDLVTSFSFNYNGNLLATTSRDRKLRVWDIRSNKIISSGAGHTGAKASRVVWLGNSDRIGTTGFSKLSDRQMGVWDSSNIQAGPIGGFYSIDASAGILIPFYDDSNKILYVGGKGDGNIRYYEFQDDELYPLSEFQSIDAQRGLAIAPKRTVNIAENEVAKAYKTVKDSIIEPISFIVPRKAEVFQDDIYPDAPSSKPALSAEEWFGGNSVEGPILVSMEDIYNKTEPTLRPSVKTETKKEGPKAEEPPKEEPEKEERREPPELVAERSKSASLTPPKSNVDDLLKKNEVNSLLKKAAALDGDEEEPKEEKNDAWDEESEPLKASNDKDGQIKKEEQKPEQKPEAKKEEQKPEQKLEAKKEEQKPEQKLEAKKEEQKPEQKLEEKKNEPKPEQKLEAKKDEPKEGPMSFKSETKTEAASKPLTLKGSIDKLAQVVDGFEKIVSRLEAANLEKDERLKALEDKIAQLLAEK
jgi:coronin-1B/1C/6